MRVDKDFNLSKRTYLNVYFQFLNLLNTKNIIHVYPATGSPEDDGYLTAPEWQENINQQLDPQAYRDLYTLRMNTPSNYSQPLRIRMGVIFNF